MSPLPRLLQDRGLDTAVAGLLYTATITAAALTATFASARQRHRAVRDVLKSLLRWRATR